MSQENVDVVRSISAPWEQGDFSSVVWAHPEIEFETPTGRQRAAGRPGRDAEGLARAGELATPFREQLPSGEALAIHGHRVERHA